MRGRAAGAMALALTGTQQSFRGGKFVHHVERR
jgi:hypothetical protein